MADRTRFSGQSPCPVCSASSKGCHRTDDGLIFCRGASAEKGARVGEYACLGIDANETFRLFRLHREREPRLRAKAPRSTPPPEPSLIDWDKRLVEAHKRLSEDRKAAMAETLGVPLAAILRLSPGVEFTGVGMDQREQFAFPMTNGAGRICGLAHRDRKTGEKKAAHGSKLGAFAFAEWKEGEGPVFSAEGASDACTLVAMGLSTLSRPSAKAGSQAIADLLHGVERDVIVLGEMDPKENGDWPGRDGAISTAKKLAASLGRPVQWAFPPGGAKDVRAWFKAQGLSHESDIDSCHAAGEQFVAELKLQTVRPPEGGEDDPELIETENDIPTLEDARAAGATKKWVWDGWLQADVVNGLLAEFGDGKTRFIGELIRRIRAGESWPDGSEMTLPPDSKFLVVPADYQHSELCDLATEYGFPDNCVFLNAPKNEPDGVSLFDSREAIACLEKRVAVLRPALVFVDPIVATTTQLSHSSAEDNTAIYGPLQRIARKYQTAFVIAVHTNKDGTTYGRHARGKFRTEVKITKLDMGGEERYRLEVSKSNSVKPPPLGATQKNHRWDFNHDPPAIEPEVRGKSGPKAKAVEEAACFIRQRLATGESLQCEIVAAWEQAGHSPKSVFAAAKQMLGGGDLEEGKRLAERKPPVENMATG